MNTDRRKAWTLILGMLSRVWAFIEPNQETAEAWEFALSDLSLTELEEGARSLLGNSTKQPTPADLREAIRGKLTWVDVWQRDQWGSLVTRNGARVSVGRKQVRLREGEEPPMLLSWGSVDDEHWGGQRPKKHEPLLLPSSITAALERKTRPPQ